METQYGLDYASVFTVLSEFVEIGLVVINPSGEMDFASRQARSLLGCGDELSLDACHTSVRKPLAEIVDQVRSGAAKSGERQVRFDADGERRDLLIEAHPIDEQDCAGVLLLVRNADNMRKMALDLRMAAQFRNTRRLYRSVVHDLKQPLTAVSVHIDLLRDLLDSDGREEAEEDVPELRSLRVIKKQVADLGRTLTLLLEEIQPAETEERGFSLRDVLDDVCRLIEPQAADQGVELSLKASKHAARMNGSRQRIKQAILNVAVNALDAMPEGGRLDITLVVAQKQATIAICDTGSGIPDDVLPHIFEMHYTTKAAGTGAGLFVARDVIQRHGGSIEAETNRDRGATFRTVLPVSETGT